MIELKPRKEKHPLTGEPIFPDGVAIYAYGFLSAYCDFPGAGINIIRGGCEHLRGRMEEVCLEHFRVPCKDAQCKIPQDEETTDDD